MPRVILVWFKRYFGSSEGSCGGQAHFPFIVVYKAKMAKKYAENCHKMPKNGLNDLEFGPNMYYDDSD